MTQSRHTIYSTAVIALTRTRRRHNIQMSRDAPQSRLDETFAAHIASGTQWELEGAVYVRQSRL